MSEDAPQEPDEQIPPERRAEIEECFRAQAENVYGVLFRLTQGDAELARVLVQHTFQEVTRTWSQLRDQAEDIRTKWLVRMAVNSAIDVFRHAGTERKKWPLVCMYYTPPETSVEDRVMTGIAVEQFIKVINKMPRQRARVAFLYWRLEWTNGEIAKALGITPAGVSDHIAKAKVTLRRELGPYVPFEVGEPEGDACS